jgi:hypothetical protein
MAVGDASGGIIAGPGTAPVPAGDPVQDWEAIRAQSDIQYSPVVPPKEIPRPESGRNWLADFFDWLSGMLKPVAEMLGVSWPVLQWILIGVGGLFLLYLLWKLVQPMARIRFKRDKDETGDEGWVPDREQALALLDDADRLAAEGRFDEATRLLLQRSVGQIAAARPDWLGPSSTAREIAALPALPDRARSAFTAIAERVERSLFALRHLSADDWQAARTAYAEFALADFSRVAA